MKILIWCDYFHRIRGDLEKMGKEQMENEKKNNVSGID
jgi:hypothetical protein